MGRIYLQCSVYHYEDGVYRDGLTNLEDKVEEIFKD